MATDLLLSALQRLQSVCGPFHHELYAVRGKLMTAYLLAGEYEKAFEQCQQVVSYLVLSLQHVPYHPLLGLQLFTSGDLASHCGENVYAEEMYRWSRKILSVAYDGDNDLLVRLNDCLC
eukprot:CAMPEP_0201100042 /NCGR_PEP_ID=MMETSP0812-20130820/8999_1 /ASSEMBLY_ACC=CAM_ASM_000668 /TAXON_ID=98059 /ORGANISM="Dinobryon sp., Strain UTEXLB2267" /LENGTH=118 /DNA_ID=CAMNT_0047356249 /DNA_START=92 /DNA_END=448 /DNA_ORIENTATION=-